MKKIALLFFLIFQITAIKKLNAADDPFVGSSDESWSTSKPHVEILFSPSHEVDKMYKQLQIIFNAIKANNLDLLKEKYETTTFLFGAVTWTGSNLLHLAVIFNRLEIADFLLRKARISPDLFDNFNETPLSYAIRFNHYEIAKLLIKYRADINIQNKKGRTPLHLAILYKKPLMVQLLLHSGAEREIPDREGIVPFNYYKYYDL